MLISLVLNLESTAPAELPAFLGRANYAEVLAHLNRVDSDLGTWIHRGLHGPKPITCSNLHGGKLDGDCVRLEAGTLCHIRLTGLVERVSKGLMAIFLAQRPREWAISGHRFRIREVICNQNRELWSGKASYGTLFQKLNQPAVDERRVALRLVSPLSFQSKDMQLPVPLPGLVFGSLVDRWNAFSPYPIESAVRAFAEEMVGISRYDLKTAEVPQKDGGIRIGATGEVVYQAMGGHGYWLNALQVLADYALFSGVGVKTTEGMGQVRRLG